MIYRMAPFIMTLNNPNPVFKVTLFFDAEYLKRLKIRPILLWKMNRNVHPSFQMVPVWMTLMTSNPDVKVMIIQCQITQKWYNIELYIQ